MAKTIVTSIFVVLLVGLLFLVFHLKDAYKVLPMSTSSEMEVPTFADWREFVASSGRFKVLLPAVPQYAKESVDIPNTDKKRRYEMYVSQKVNGTIFMISLITYPEEVNTSNSAQMLQDFVQEMMATNPGNQLRNLTNTSFQNHAAADFHIVNNEFDVQGKAFMLQKTMYVLTYVTKLDDINNSEYQYFLNSFQLLGKTENPAK